MDKNKQEVKTHHKRCSTQVNLSVKVSGFVITDSCLVHLFILKMHWFYIWSLWCYSHIPCTQGLFMFIRRLLVFISLGKGSPHQCLRRGTHITLCTSGKLPVPPTCPEAGVYQVIHLSHWNLPSSIMWFKEVACPEGDILQEGDNAAHMGTVLVAQDNTAQSMGYWKDSWFRETLGFRTPKILHVPLVIPCLF